MPELPEVEVVVRKLRPDLIGKTIHEVSVRRLRIITPHTEREFTRKLKGARFIAVDRRAKYLVFTLRRGKDRFTLLGHLGMSGDMYVVSENKGEPKHAAVVLSLGKEKFIYEDTRYFGRMTFDTVVLEPLGPEPLATRFAPQSFAERLRRSGQPIKVKLLDQTLVAGLGNIYASEALFYAGIPPNLPSRKLTDQQITHLWRVIRKVLTKAIACGATRGDNYPFAVYSRKGKPCIVCRAPIRHSVQAARSTYYCATCQKK